MAVVVDLRSRRIPNVLTGGLAAAGLGLAALGAAPVTPALAAAGLVVGLLVMLPGHLLGATGGGDVKLMGAVGTLLGPGPVIWAFLFTSLAGGVLALAIAARRQRVSDTLAGTRRLVAAPARAPQEVRSRTAASRFAYGPAIAIGSLAAAWIA